MTRPRSWIVFALACAALPGCKSMKVRSLTSSLQRELPADCTSFAGTAAAGATCQSDQSVERAKAFFTARCSDLRDIGLVSVTVRNSGANSRTWMITDFSGDCEFRTF